MVAAWIRAETGVGPSIASGSQVCSPICADLPIAPTNSSRQSVVRMSTLWPAKMKLLARHGRRGCEHRVEIQRLEHGIDAENAQREAEIAHPVDDEGLDRGGVGGRPRVPEADQQIGRQAHPFPAEEQLQEIVGRHQHQHGEGEERQDRRRSAAGAGLRAM